MMQDVLHSPENLSIDEISSPISTQNFDFCDPEMFQETLHNSEVASSSNCCYEENSYVTNFSLPPDVDKLHSYQDNNISTNISSTTTTTTSSTTTTGTNTTAATNNNDNISAILDSKEELDNDISASINFSPSPSFPFAPFLTAQQDQIDFASLQSQIPVTDGVVDGLSQYTTDPVVPLMGPPLTFSFEEDCSSSVPSYMPMNPTSSCSFLRPPMGTFMHGTLNSTLSADSSAMFAGGVFMGSELQPHELDFQEENGGIYFSDSMQRAFNSGDLQQALGNESQQLVSGGANPNDLSSEMPNLEESTFKVGKLSVEQRKEKIHRYMKKRNERNFSKKIKYACRKTLADSRPRVRGRFAKNDDFGETHRPACSNHEEDDYEEVVVKEEDDDMVDSSDIFAHISGVNSFKCNYPIQSWI